MKYRSLLKVLYGLLAAGLMVSCMGMEESVPSSLQVPELKSFEVKDNGSLFFELTASVDKRLSERVAECGFYYGKEKSMNGAQKIVCKMFGGTFYADITLHEYGETFYACSYISNGVEGNEICSEPKSITVKELQDYVEFSDPALISYDKSSAKVSVDYKTADGVEVTESGVCFGKTESLSIDNGSVKAVDGVAELLDLEVGETYFVSSYVKDGDDVAYNRSVPFSVYGIPIVVTGNEPEADSYSAALCGEVEDDCGKEITERGFLWCEGAVEILDVSKNAKVKCGAGIGEFNHTLTELKPNMTYSFCAYAMNAEGTAYGEIVRFTTGIALAELKSPIISEFSSTSAVLKCELLNDGGETPSTVGFYYSTFEDVSPSSAKIVSAMLSGSEFSAELSGLTRVTKYYVRSYAVNSAGESVSDVVSFVTSMASATVETASVTKVTTNSAVSGGNVTDDGGSEVTAKGLVWSTSQHPTVALSTKTDSGKGTGPFTDTMTGLKPNTLYYVRAYAITSAGTSYGEETSFTTNVALPAMGDVTVFNITSSSTKVSCYISSDGGETPSELGFYCSTSEEVDPMTSIKVIGKASGSSFTAELKRLTRATKYYVRAYALNSAGEAVSSPVSFSTLAELPEVGTAALTEITYESAVCGGNVTDDGGAEILAKGIVWSTSKNPTVSLRTKTNVGKGVGEFSSTMTGLLPATKYYVRAYATNSVGTSYGSEDSFTTADEPFEIMDAANCFIISDTGIYTFMAVKGNSSESVGAVKYVEVLWESFGTSTAPKVGDLIKSVSYSDGYITFQTADYFREGNAVIAARNASDTILWSWHIWLTDQPGKCVYANNAGTMMDRNLGATSATPGDVGALGLLYQWGRKDPFLSSSSISSSVEAKSTISWPSAVSSSSSRGTLSYAIEHPTTFITCNNSKNYDWYYSDNQSTDDTRWQSTKTIYDPCPAGWRVPAGGSNGVWNKAGFVNQSYDSYDKGMFFGYGISSPATWYQAAGYRDLSDGSLLNVGIFGFYWSVTPNGYDAYYLNISNYGYVEPTRSSPRARGQSIRCLQE